MHKSAQTVNVLFEALRVSIEKLLQRSFPIFWCFILAYVCCVFNMPVGDWCSQSIVFVGWDFPLADETCKSYGLDAQERHQDEHLVLQILRTMLRSYRDLLPFTSWRTVCMHCMYVMEETLSRLEQCPGAEAPLEVQAGDKNESTSLCTVLCASRALAQQTLCVLHSVMHEAPAVSQCRTQLRMHASRSSCTSLADSRMLTI